MCVLYSSKLCLVMPACAVYGCNINQGPSNKGAAPYSTCFTFPSAKKYPELRKKWLSFCGQGEGLTNPTRSNGICIRHFEEKHLSKAAKITPRLDYKTSPTPTLFGPKPQAVLKASSSYFFRYRGRSRIRAKL